MSESNPNSPRWGENQRSAAQNASDLGKQQQQQQGRQRPSDDDDEDDFFSDIKGDEAKSTSRERQTGGRGGDEEKLKWTPRSASEEYEREPAYVAPIPKIPAIASVAPIGGPSSQQQQQQKTPQEPKGNIPSLHRPRIPQWVTASLIGKQIDEYGDVVDDEGRVLGRVAGDLPSMVGRTVLNQRGDVLSDDGELLGYVAEVAKPKGKDGEGSSEGRKEGTGVVRDSGADGDGDDSNDNDGDDGEEYSDPRAQDSPVTPPKSIDQYIGGPSASLQVDHRGNILDSFGNIVGHFRDSLKNPKTPEEEARERKQQEEEARRRKQSGATPAPEPKTEGWQNPPRKPFVEGRENAQAWRKENESPSDIFLDVKSTTEGIQLTIRIPTVFPGGGRPVVNFTS